MVLHYHIIILSLLKMLQKEGKTGYSHLEILGKILMVANGI